MVHATIDDRGTIELRHGWLDPRGMAVVKFLCSTDARKNYRDHMVSSVIDTSAKLKKPSKRAD